jgi:hypothetical protein
MTYVGVGVRLVGASLMVGPSLLVGSSLQRVLLRVLLLVFVHVLINLLQ